MSEAASRIIEGAREALAIAKGEQPAASMTINGHKYVPADQLESALAVAAYAEFLLHEALACHNEGTGLLDSIDNMGGRYTSQRLHQTIEAIRAFLIERKGDSNDGPS